MNSNVVNEQTSQREATATIRGYLYQFDASILAILASPPGNTITVEGIEDFDISGTTTDVHAQVKYYEAQKLTDSTLRDAIIPMLQGFMLQKTEDRKRKNYVLYGHFREAPITQKSLSVEDLKRALVYKPYSVDKKTGERTRLAIDLQKKIGASDKDLKDFCSRLKIVTSEPFDDHRQKVIEKLRSELSVSKLEAESYCYPSSLHAIAALSTSRTKKDRTTTKKDFLNAVSPNKAIYSAWALREEGEISYCRKIREQHFSALNIDGKDRFFIIDLPQSEGTTELYELVTHIINRWSSHKISGKPNRERYAPIFFFPGASPEDLRLLKVRLDREKYRFTDGHPYLGCEFSVDHLMAPQTKEFPVSARFVSNEEQLLLALAASTKGRLAIQMYANDAIKLPGDLHQINVLVHSAGMAQRII